MIDFTIRMIKYLLIIVGSQAHKADYFVISAAIDNLLVSIQNLIF